MLKLPATFDRFSSRSDGSYGLSFSSQEADLGELAMLHGHVRQFGWLLFKEQEIKDEDIPDEDPDDDSKTPSQRLRSRMFVYWKSKVNDGDFKKWYQGQMEKIGDRYLEKLD